MKTWDIIDRVFPGIEITERNTRKTKIAPTGKVSTFSMLAGLIIATSATFCLDAGHLNQLQANNLQKKRAASVALPRSATAGSSADTGEAMSGSKLARAFAANFEPAEEEAEYRGGYLLN